MSSLASIEEIPQNDVDVVPGVKCWLVKYQGKEVLSVMELRISDRQASGLGYIVVEAETKEEAQEKAKKKVYNTYCARKKKEAKLRHYARNECACGRPQDRYRENGTTLFRTCSVCSARQPAYNEKYKERVNNGTVGQGPRDEKARIAKNLERQRDRRKEIRIETLLEVRKHFWNMPHVKDFAAWLDKSIEASK